MTSRRERNAPELRINIDSDTYLHTLTARDAPQLFALTDQNRLYLRKWLPWVDATQSVEDTLAFIQSTWTQYANNEGFSCGIWYKHQLAGTIGYHSIDWSNRKVEIGYWLAAVFQGKGIMTRSCRAMVVYAFDTLQLRKIEIRCAVGNHRSCAIPQRLGFRPEGLIRQAEWLYDHFVDLTVYAMLAHDWKQEV
ncbi:MAG: GNAT family N-acetyltransferase [Ktedonobacteraceae bacterium]|nr:GNAT family N-acetyltransferase [Ktedonobacteraceae bacterium]